MKVPAPWIVLTFLLFNQFPAFSQATQDPCASAQQQLQYYFLEYNDEGYLNQKYLEDLFYACDSVSVSTEVSYYYLRSISLLEVEDEYVAKPRDIFYFFYKNFKQAAAQYVNQADASADFIQAMSLRADQLETQVARAERYGDKPFLDGREAPTTDRGSEASSSTPTKRNFRSFPISPDAYTDYLPLQGNTLAQAQTLADIDAFLTQNLNQAGYYGKQYFGLPEGFALVTQMEKIYPDGKPYPTIDRWATSVKHNPTFSLRQYFLSLVFAEPGSYRAFAFVVLPSSIAENPKLALGRWDPKAWQGVEGEKLPPSIAQLSISGEYTIGLYCFIFQQKTNADGAYLLALPIKNKAGSFAQQHLVQAGLFPYLIR